MTRAKPDTIKPLAALTITALFALTLAACQSASPAPTERTAAASGTKSPQALTGRGPLGPRSRE